MSPSRAKTPHDPAKPCSFCGVQRADISLLRLRIAKAEGAVQRGDTKHPGWYIERIEKDRRALQMTEQTLAGHLELCRELYPAEQETT